MEKQPAKLFSNCPWENQDNSSFFEIPTKRSVMQAVPNPSKKEDPGVATALEVTKDGIPKALINNFYYRTPFGYPRYKDLDYYRNLASSVYVDMCTTAIIDEVCSVQWDIIAEDDAGNDLIGKEKEIEECRAFFNNPNTNKESWEDVVRQMLPDLLEINSGIWVKVFNMMGRMVEIVSRDGASFTKNPDIYGMYTSRADLISVKEISPDQGNSAYPVINGALTPEQAKNEAAYFQYGWNTASRPIPFGKREIVWLEKKRRTDELYGRSAMEVLTNTVQTLIYAVEHNLEYFNDNSIPPGVLGLDGMTSKDVKAFGKQWIESQKVQDTNGYWKKTHHKLPIVNHIPKFERLGFTNQELQIIEQQKWWAKLVWAAFGLTSTELGFTEDAKGNANQIVQSSIARKRIIYPILRLIEYHVNTEIIPEFGYIGIKYKYKIFDVDEETKKWNLYKVQKESGLKTANEIRNSEGLDPIDGGDQLSSYQQGNNFYMGNNPNNEYGRQNQSFQNQRDQMQGKPEKEDSIKKSLNTDQIKLLDDIVAYMEKKLGKQLSCEQKEKIIEEIETKPFAGYRNFQDCVNRNRNKRDPKAYCATIMRQVEGKQLDTNLPTILGPGEEMSHEKKLKKIIIDLLRGNEKKINEILTTQRSEDQLIKIKAIGDVPKMIEKIFETFGLKQLSDAIIKDEFLKGWDYSERKLNRNIQFNDKALQFLQDHTFDNIKGMTEEIANDLKAELERGIINGEGIEKLKERVKKVINKGENRAEMIARTETNRADNQGRLLAMKGSGLRLKKKWVATEDDRTSEICKRLDGQIVELNENFHDSKTGWEGQSPPSHVDCRSTVVFIQEDEQ